MLFRLQLIELQYHVAKKCALGDELNDRLDSYAQERWDFLLSSQSLGRETANCTIAN
jgi:hypothetical protein